MLSLDTWTFQETTRNGDGYPATWRDMDNAVDMGPACFVLESKHDWKVNAKILPRVVVNFA
jgi:hypothetical protein